MILLLPRQDFAVKIFNKYGLLRKDFLGRGALVYKKFFRRKVGYGNLLPNFTVNVRLFHTGFSKQVQAIHLPVNFNLINADNSRRQPVYLIADYFSVNKTDPDTQTRRVPLVITRQALTKKKTVPERVDKSTEQDIYRQRRVYSVEMPPGKERQAEERTPEQFIYSSDQRIAGPVINKDQKESGETTGIGGIPLQSFIFIPALRTHLKLSKIKNTRVTPDSKKTGAIIQAGTAAATIVLRQLRVLERAFHTQTNPAIRIGQAQQQYFPNSTSTYRTAGDRTVGSGQDSRTNAQPIARRLYETEQAGQLTAAAGIPPTVALASIILKQRRTQEKAFQIRTNLVSRILQKAIQFIQSRGDGYTGSRQVNGTISHTTTYIPVVTLDKFTNEERRTQEREFQIQTSNINRIVRATHRPSQSSAGLTRGKPAGFRQDSGTGVQPAALMSLIREQISYLTTAGIRQTLIKEKTVSERVNKSTEPVRNLYIQENIYRQRQVNSEEMPPGGYRQAEKKTPKQSIYSSELKITGPFVKGQKGSSETVRIRGILGIILRYAAIPRGRRTGTAVQTTTLAAIILKQWRAQEREFQRKTSYINRVVHTTHRSIQYNAGLTRGKPAGSRQDSGTSVQKVTLESVKREEISHLTTTGFLQTLTNKKTFHERVDKSTKQHIYRQRQAYSVEMPPGKYRQAKKRTPEQFIYISDIKVVNKSQKRSGETAVIKGIPMILLRNAAAPHGRQTGTAIQAVTAAATIVLRQLRTLERTLQTKTNPVIRIGQVTQQHFQSSTRTYKTTSNSTVGSGQDSKTNTQATARELYETERAGQLTSTDIPSAATLAAIILKQWRTQKKVFKTQTSIISEILQTALQYIQSWSYRYTGSGQVSRISGKTTTSIPVVILDKLTGKQRHIQDREFQIQASYINRIVHAIHRSIQYNAGLTRGKPASSRQDGGTSGRTAALEPVKREQISHLTTTDIRQALTRKKTVHERVDKSTEQNIYRQRQANSVEMLMGKVRQAKKRTTEQFIYGNDIRITYPVINEDQKESGETAINRGIPGILVQYAVKPHGRRAGTMVQAVTSAAVVVLRKLRTLERTFQAQTNSAIRIGKAAQQYFRSSTSTYRIASNRTVGSGQDSKTNILAIAKGLYKTEQAGQLKATGIPPAATLAAIILKQLLTQDREFQTQSSYKSRIVYSIQRFIQSRGLTSDKRAGSGQDSGTGGRTTAGKPVKREQINQLTEESIRQMFAKKKTISEQAYKSTEFARKSHMQEFINRRHTANNLDVETLRRYVGLNKRLGTPGRSDTPIGVKYEAWIQKTPTEALYKQVLRLLEQYANRRRKLQITEAKPVQGQKFGKQETAGAAAENMSITMRRTFLGIIETPERLFESQGSYISGLLQAALRHMQNKVNTYVTFTQARVAPMVAGELPPGLLSMEKAPSVSNALGVRRQLAGLVTDNRRQAMMGNNIQRTGKMEQFVQTGLNVKTETLRRYETIANTRMEYLKQQAAPAGSRQSDAVSQSPAQAEVNLEKIDVPVSQNPEIDINKIVDKVYMEIERKIKHERQRRGF